MEKPKAINWVEDHFDVICLTAAVVGGGVLGFGIGYNKGVFGTAKILPDCFDRCGELGYQSAMAIIKEKAPKQFNKIINKVGWDVLNKEVTKRFYEDELLQKAIEACNSVKK